MINLGVSLIPKYSRYAAAYPDLAFSAKLRFCAVENGEAEIEAELTVRSQDLRILSASNSANIPQFIEFVAMPH